MRKLIGLMGKKRSGKDTAAEVFVGEGFIKFAYGDKLKEVVRFMYPALTYGQLYGEQKEDMTEYGYSARHLMQEIGENFRDIDPLIWMRPLDRLYRSTQVNIVVTDVRHDNEMEQIWRLHGEIWEVKRPALNSLDTHKSENGIHLSPDVVVRNVDTKEGFQAEVRRVWNS